LLFIAGRACAVRALRAAALHDRDLGREVERRAFVEAAVALPRDRRRDVVL
jgi:hypothetical protein